MKANKGKQADLRIRGRIFSFVRERCHIHMDVPDVPEPPGRDTKTPRFRMTSPARKSARNPGFLGVFWIIRI